MKYTFQNYLDNECTLTEYKNCLKGVKPELGKTYIQDKGSWSEKHFKIIFVDENIAIGISVFNKISQKFIGDYDMFSVKDGWRYTDTRPNYRLSEEVNEKV